MSETPNEPLLVSSMRRRATDRRVHVRVGIPGARGSISTTAAGFLTELDAYIEGVRAEARTVTTEQLDAAARASWQESWAPFAEAHAGADVTWEQVAPGAKASWRRDAAAVLRAVGLTVPDGPGTSVGATTEEAP